MLRMWAMQFSRARRLSSASTVYHGACLMSVCLNISSLAFENSTHFSRDWMSMSLSFQRRAGFPARSRKRRSCSSSLTENQYFSRMMPEWTSIRSNSGQERRNSVYSSGGTKAHDVLHPGPVVPAPVEQDDLPGGGQVGDVALEVP